MSGPGGIPAPEDWPGPALEPGTAGPLTEAQWSEALLELPLLHQWGPALLVDEGPAGCVRLYLRDDSGRGWHRLLRLDAAASLQAREGVERIERASRAAALRVAEQLAGPSTPAEMRRQEEASQRFVQAAEALYRSLLAGAAPARATGGDGAGGGPPAGQPPAG